MVSLMFVKRRFIAGARCPKCHAQESIVMLTSAEQEWIECVDCHYTEQRPTEVTSVEATATHDIGVVQFKTFKIEQA